MPTNTPRAQAPNPAIERARKMRAARANLRWHVVYASGELADDQPPPVYSMHVGRVSPGDVGTLRRVLGMQLSDVVSQLEVGTLSLDALQAALWLARRQDGEPTLQPGLVTVSHDDTYAVMNADEAAAYEAEQADGLDGLDPLSSDPS